MGQERRHFTDEFKREAVALLVSSGRPLSQMANELGISLDAAQPPQLQRRAGRGGGAARDPGLGPAFGCGPSGGDSPAASRDRSAADGARHFKRGCGIFSEPAEMRFRLIEDHQGVWSVRVMCDALSVSPSGYYA